MLDRIRVERCTAVGNVAAECVTAVERNRSLSVSLQRNTAFDSALTRTPRFRSLIFLLVVIKNRGIQSYD